MIDLADIISLADMKNMNGQTFNEKLFWFIQFAKQFPKESLNDPEHPNTYDLVHDILDILNRLYHRPSTNIKNVIEGFDIPETFHFDEFELLTIAALKNAIFIMFLAILVRNVMRHLDSPNVIKHLCQLKPELAKAEKRYQMSFLHKRHNFFLKEAIEWLYLANKIERKDTPFTKDPSRMKISDFWQKTHLRATIAKLNRLKNFCVENEIA